MANSQTVQVNFKAIADFNDVTSNVKQIQTALNQLKMPDSLKSSFAKSFKDLEAGINKAQSQLAKGFTSKSDVTNYSKTLNHLNSIMGQIQTSMSKISPDILRQSFQVDTAQLDAANQKILEAKKNLTQSTGKAGLKSDISEIVDKLNKLSGVKGVKELKENFAKGDLDSVSQTVDRLTASLVKNQSKVEAGNEKWVAYAQCVKELKTVLNSPEIQNAANDLLKAQQEAEDLSNTEFNKLLGSFERVKEATGQIKDGMHQYGESTLGAAEDTQRLGSEMDQLKSRIAMFFGLNNAVQLFQRGLRSAFATVQDLDKVMTETAVVTDFSVGDMWEQLPDYTKRANELGVSIHDAYEAATIYYQQGLQTNEVMQITNATLKMGRIASLDSATATDRMTNALRGFNMEINEMNAERISDVYSKLAAMSASNVDEISTAMTKVASLASSANMEFETTSAFLAQMIETTREAPETAGTALKTIVARFSEVKELFSQGELLGQDAEGEAIDVNKVSKALRTAGIDLNEFLSGAKGLDDILLELASKWNDLDIVQQRYIATTAAGSRQQSRFIAMMSDYGRTMELVNGANNSAGASQAQYEKTLESLETKITRLKNAWNEFVMAIADSAIIKGAVDALRILLTTINKLTSWLPGIIGGFTKLWIAISAFKLGKNIFVGLFKSIAPNLMTEARADAAKFTNVFSLGIKEGLSKTSNLFKKLKFSAELDKQVNQMKKPIGEILNLTDEIAFATEELNGLDDEMMIGEITSAQNQAYTERLVLLNSCGVAEETYTAIQEAGLSVEEQKIALALASKGALEGMTAEEIKAAVAEQGIITAKKLSIKEFIKSTATKITEAGASAMAAVANANLGVASTAAAQGVALLNSATVSLAAKLLIVVGVATAVIGVLVGIGFAIGAIIKGIKNASPEAKLAAAEEAATKLGEAADKTAEKFDNLSTSLTEIAQHTNDLDGLIEGTQEWRDAVSELNNEVLDLIQAYPEMAQFMTSENGVMSIDFDKKNFEGKTASNILNDYQTQMNKAQAAEIVANKALTDAQLNMQAKDTRKGFGKFASADFTNEQIKQIASDLTSGNFTSNEEGALEFEGYGSLYNKRINENIDSLTEFGNQIQAAAVAQENYNQTLVDSSLANSDLTKAQQKEAKAYWNSDRIDKQIEKEKQNVTIDDWKEDYSKAMGYASYDKYKEENGALKHKDKSSAKDVITEYKAAEKVYDDIAKKSELLTKSGLNNQQKNLLNGQLTSENLNSIKETGLQTSIDSIWEALGEDANKLYDNKQEFANEIQGIVEEAKTQEETANKLSDQDLKSSSVLESLDLETLSNFTEQLENVFQSSGQQSAETIMSTFGEITKGLDSGEASRFAQALSSIDWTDTNDINGLADTLRDLGFTAQVDSEEYQELINQIKEGSNAINKFNLDRFNKQMEGARQALADLFANPDKKNFTEDEYNNIVAGNSELKSDFVQQLDGSFTYIGESNDRLVTALQENTVALLNKTEEQLKKQRRTAQILNDKDENGEGTDTKYKDVLKNASISSSDELKTGLADMLKSIIGTGINLEDLGIAGLKDLGAGEVDSYLSGLNLEGLQNLASSLNAIRENEGQYEQDINAIETQKQTSAFLEMNNPSQVAQRATELKNVQASEGLNDDGVRELAAAMAALASTMVNAGVGDQLRAQAGNSQNQQASLANTFQEAQGLGIDTQQLNDYTLALQQANQELANNPALAAEVALANTKMNNGLSEIISSYGDWTALIDESTGVIKASSSDDIQVFDSLKKSVNKMLNTSKDLSKSFWDNAANMKNIKKAAEGDTEALGELQKAAAEDYLVQVATEADTAEAYQAIMDLNNFVNGYELPTLEAGVSLDDSQFIAKCNEMIAASGMTASQVSDYFKNIGYDAEVEMKEATAPGSTRTVHTSGTRINPASGEKEPVEATYTETVDPATVMVPVVKSLTSTGSGGGGFSVGNQNAGRKNGGGGRGGGGGSKEKYKNEHDKRYNLVQDIAEEQRTLNKLQDEQNKLLDGTNTKASALIENYEKQIASLQKQKKLNQEMLKYRTQDFKEYLSENSKYSKYATYNWKDHTVEINWDELNKITDSEEGQEVDDYISKLEDFESKMDEAEDTLMDIDNQIEDLTQEYRDAYVDSLNTVRDAIVEAKEKEIDKLSELNDTIDDQNSRMFDAIEKAIDEQRQARENDKTEKDLADKQNRLAALQMDTSGGNELEILQLQKEIDDAKQDYQDSLIDQQLQRMQDDADEASEQRQRQIDLLENQLEISQLNGDIWKEVYDLWNNGFTSSGKLNWSSPLGQLLRQQEDYAKASDAEKVAKNKELSEDMAKGLVGEQKGYYKDIDYSLEIQAAEKGIVSKQTGIDYSQLSESERKDKLQFLESQRNEKIDALNMGEKKTYKYNEAPKTQEKPKTSTPASSTPATTQPSKPSWSRITSAYNQIQSGKWGNGVDNRIANGKKAGYTEEEVRLGQKYLNYRYSGKTEAQAKKLMGYKTGGLADFTGPAWLDGTKSHPELVLNAKDTDNFIQLKNILSEVMKSGNLSNSENSGDNYYEVHIEVEKISDDYDVEDMASKIKNIIQQDAMYRNVNFINHLR